MPGLAAKLANDAHTHVFVSAWEKRKGYLPATRAARFERMRKEHKARFRVWTAPMRSLITRCWIFLGCLGWRALW
eukprot:94957-Pelagomonas_calceolata.AAC.5